MLSINKKVTLYKRNCSKLKCKYSFQRFRKARFNVHYLLYSSNVKKLWCIQMLIVGLAGAEDAGAVCADAASVVSM